jgi:hypothetical protein
MLKRQTIPDDRACHAAGACLDIVRFVAAAITLT